jgi:hypothetical protein
MLDFFEMRWYTKRKRKREKIWQQNKL